MNELIQTLALAAIPVLFAITLHEAAHGYAARHFGDSTAHQLGRISLNPIRHIDPLGTLLVPALTLMLGGLLFGWAKPVPVKFSALNNPKRDMMWVALAGPAANLLMAIGWVILLKLALIFADNYYAEPLARMALIGIKINVILMALNMLPLPPLDGGRVAVSLLPAKQAYSLSRVEPYGMFILIFLAITPVLGWILAPFVGVVNSVLFALVGL